MTAELHPSVRDVRSLALGRQVRALVAFTITYNVVEAVVALSAGTVAGSAALLGFGLDSVVEVSSALAVAWQFTGPRPEDRERVALRVVAASFLTLAIFVAVDAIGSLVAGQEPDSSRVGVVLAALSLVVMPVVSGLQRRAGRELGSQSAVADSRQTLLCTCMSAALLVGLLLNAAVGWWWADPAAAMVIAGLAVREGVNAWRGEVCCAPGPSRGPIGCGGACDCC